MNTQRLRELCDAVENGSARAEDVLELARLAREAAKRLDDATATMRRSASETKHEARREIERYFLRHA
jgi:F0F1-type ATP synthase membrane subunit b/b'